MASEESTPPSSGKRYVIMAVAAVALLLVGAVAGGLLQGDYTTRQSASRTFMIDMDFTKVRKIMVRSDAAKEIVTMGGGSEFIEQHWEQAAVNASGENIGEALLQNLFSSDPDWNLSLKGTLKVRTLDDYIGQHVITLQQEVDIDPDKIDSQVHLEKGSERLKAYHMHTQLSRDGEQTKVELSLDQEIKTHAPWFAHGIADRRVRESAEKTLENQETAMRELIEQNKDKAGIFPLN